MRLNVYLIMIVGLSGCGSSIAALESLPAGPDVNSAEWPKLIDTPALPAEGLLSVRTGEHVIERLDRQGGEVEARRKRADAVLPVSEQLTARAIASRSRSDAVPIPSVDEASLLARAAQSHKNTQGTSVQVNERDLLARAVRQRARNVDNGFRVDESDLLARAARQRERTVNAAPADGKDDLRARSLLAQSKAGNIAPASPPANDASPRAPRPLRPLDSPVISSSFEERARRARLRASEAGT